MVVGIIITIKIIIIIIIIIAITITMMMMMTWLFKEYPFRLKHVSIIACI